MLRVAVSGACGKMGNRIISLAKEDKDLEVVLGLENKNHPNVGKTDDGIKIIDSPQEIKNCDCLIEFTTPLATLEHLSYLVKFKKAVVIGTTGFSESEQDRIKEAAAAIPIVFSPNMSVGVNLLFRLLKEAAGALKGYQVNIQEAHHIHKKDAPSGTAKRIAQIINEQGFNIKVEDIEAKREDEIVGDHRITFESDVDKIELQHCAKTRDIFAKGALLAAKWIVNKKPGLYSMENVLFNK